MENVSPSKIAPGSTQTTILKESTAPQHSPLQLPRETVATKETTSTCLMAMQEPQTKLGSLNHRHTSTVKAGMTVAVPAAFSKKFYRDLNNFEEEMDSEEGGKEEEGKDKKELEDNEVREDDEVVEDDEVKEMEHETNPHYNLRSSV